MTDLFIKALTKIQRHDYSLALDTQYSQGKKGKLAEEAAQAEMLTRFPVIQQQMEQLREPPKPKIKKEKPVRDKSSIDFIRDIHWVYETMGLDGQALKEAKANPPSGGALAQLKRALASETYADRILAQIRQLEMNKEKLERGAKKQVNTRANIELIDRCLAQAGTDAGVREPAHVVSENPKGHDPATSIPQEPDPPG